MIKTNIGSKFPNHLSKYNCSIENIYIADYSEQTKNDAIRRNVEIFPRNPPPDINYFSVLNTPNLNIAYIDFDNTSFIDSNGKSKTQCECVLFPEISDNTSWILFCELKYSSLPHNNRKNLRKALKQLFKTRYYYYQNNIFHFTNTTYLIASLPSQSEPFANFTLTPNFLIDIKKKKNIVPRLLNSVEVSDNNTLNVGF